MKIEEAILYLLVKKNGGMTTDQLAAEMVIPCSRARTDKPGIIRYLDAVEEALCFGWIDSSIYTKDGVFHQRFSPRRKRSEFSALNYARCRAARPKNIVTI